MKLRFAGFIVIKGHGLASQHGKMRDTVGMELTGRSETEVASARAMPHTPVSHHDMMDQVFPRSSSLATDHDVHRVMNEIT